MLNLYAVYDTKSESYGQLIQVRNVGVAVRSFTDACGDTNSPMAKHPGDFALYEIGTYDPDNGKLTCVEPAKHIMSAASAVPVDNQLDIFPKARGPVEPERIPDGKEGAS